jgi:type IV secretory pathway ATPase VirB11/archaellum biosynthesis ATPase
MAHDSPPDDGSQPHPASDRMPRFVAGGRVSLAALREQIEDQFVAETASRSDILLDASDESARRDLVREVADYVLAVEGIRLARADRLALLDILYTDLFHFGPLAAYLSDATVTELTIDGPERVHVRRGAGEPVAVESYFEDESHLERLVECALSTAGAQFDESEPFLEVGTVMVGRPVRLTIAAPPASPVLHVEIRLHPAQVVSLADQVAASVLDEAASRLLQAILAARHGLIIAGDAGSGKTMFLESLLPYLPEGGAVVERSAELRLPGGTRPFPFRRLVALPPATFGEQIAAALELNPAWLVLDEVRFDEAQAMWQALTVEHAPHDLWALRGATDPLRLRTAFGMSVRRAQPGIDQGLIHDALLEHLPFVALLARRDRQIRLIGIGEWQREMDQADSITLRMLWPASDAEPVHPVDWSLG